MQGFLTTSPFVNALRFTTNTALAKSRPAVSPLPPGTISNRPSAACYICLLIVQ